MFRPAALPPPAVFGIGLLQDLLTQAPGPVDEKQLRELHIRLRKAEPAQG